MKHNMETREFKSFFKEVKGNEGNKCHYSTRLDTYGCGCSHNCEYCYAKSLLDFRKLWDPENPAVADISKIKKTISKLTPGTIVRLGGMTDCFQPIELKHRVTYQTIQALNERGIGYLIVTKSALVAHDEYMSIMDKNLAHIQISITHTDDNDTRMKEGNASKPSARIAAVEKLQAAGFDVQVRLSPFIPEFVDLNVINSIKCDKILVEFLRVNTWIQKWLDIDYSQYTIKQSGYRHLPLNIKQDMIKSITGFKEVTVCEDESEAYEYWRDNFNPNKNDCCNLKL